MKKHHVYILGIALVTLILVACGPSPEEIAAMTAAAATDTPVPTNTPPPTPTNTPTPTPIPYNLTVSVTDTEGSPIPGAVVTLAELGDAEAASQAADDSGAVVWENLPGEAVTLAVSAQGYFGADQSASIERGPNELAVTLERDPFGLLPSAACGEGETLLWIDDFQDGKAQGWNQITFNAPGWHLGDDPDPERAGNLLIYAQGTPSDQPIWDRIKTGVTFENAVWRIRFMIAGRTSVSFNWRFALEPFTLEGQEVFDSRYQIGLGTDGSSGMRRLQQPITNVGVGPIYNHPKQNTWHYLEISTFGNTTEVYLDGLLVAAYEDPVGLPPGTLGLEYWPPDEATAVYFDDISVCELSAPVISLFSTEE